MRSLRTPLRLVVSATATLAMAATIATTALALLVAPIGCKGSGKGADDPISMGGSKVRQIDETSEGCQKVGQVDGIGRDSNEGLSEQQANDAAKEHAAQMGGNAILFVDNKAEKEAGSGGPVTKITKTADVYNCPAASPTTSDSSGAGKSGESSDKPAPASS